MILHRCGRWVGFNPIVFDAGAFSGEEPSSHLHPETERLPGPGRYTQGTLGNGLYGRVLLCLSTCLSAAHLSLSLPVRLSLTCFSLYLSAEV